MSSPTPSNKPRKKPVRTKSIALPVREFPLASILYPLRTTVNQWLVLPTLLIGVFLFRWAVGFGPYSGQATPPKFGDFEAQRHWMEITNHIRIGEWYWYDLEWWGLDYPPLTAYHSWLCGKIGSFMVPRWFALDESRGMEEQDLKVFMRATVAVSDYLTFIPGVVLFVRRWGKQTHIDKYDQAISIAAILMQPGLLIIDYGHFQYNAVMLGFSALAITNFIQNRLLWGSVFFVLALGFKQMALYYAPAIFAYLLGLCVSFNGTSLKIDFIQLILLGVTVIASFAALVLPFAVFHGDNHTPLQQLAQMVHRVFPFQRGLWEDKVANFWCATNVVIKYREKFPQQALQVVSLALTLGSILPFCIILFLKPKKSLLPLGVAGCAWGFFLFSFQVHEKSVLLPLMPVTLLLAGGLDRNTRSWVGWINNMAMFSMWPLLRREGLELQYVVLIGLWSYLLALHKLPLDMVGKLIQVASYAAALAVHVAELTVKGGIVERYNDIWVVANVTVSFGAFGACYLWILYRIVTQSCILKEGLKPKTE